ncbi:MAG: translation initiation factor [Zetaproteobacteria bacterium CG1_02_53_45]|nr:MAG: translation initiation factor [Zetaproteobacteria bacterium CG1_02_53_45]
MGENDRLVYSTEQGSLDKPMQKKLPAGKKKGKQTVAAPAIKNPNKQGVRIRRESKGRGGKTVCIVDGLQLNDDGLKALLKTLKAQLGTGGAVKDGCLEIQGDHRDKLLQLLDKGGIKAKLAGG